LPKKSIRPGMFISVGPSGSTVSGIITMGRNLPRVIADDFTGNGQLADQVSNWIGIWLWGLALWFFLVRVAAHWSCVGHSRMDFAMTWYTAHDCNFRRRERARQSAHAHSQLRHGVPPHPGVDVCVRFDGQGRSEEGHPVTAKAGGQGRGGMVGRR
ncbi:hypothetical protein LTR16_005824, partial [Cryomyces antarcticus]